MRSAFLSPKEYRAFAAQCLRWEAPAKHEEHKNLTLQMAYDWMQTAQNWSAPFHQARAWRRRRPRKTTLGKSRRRTISRVRVDDLLLAVLRGVTQDPSRHCAYVMDCFGRGLPALHLPNDLRLRFSLSNQ
jgi:hypothetical protein